MASPAQTRSRTIPPRAAAVANPPPAASRHRATTHGMTGRYRLDPATGSWWWSPEMYDLFQLPPESCTPSTDLLLACQHRDDRARALRAITGACADGGSFAVETRIALPDGGLRVVVLVGEPQQEPGGPVTVLEGLCVDVTGGRLAEDDDVVVALQTEVAQLRTAMASRAAIEQAKGILMLLTSCTEQVAFELLAHMSSHTHRKVREVATSLVESAAGHAPLPDDLRAIVRDACPPAPRLR
jgi:ANTAR domain/PAS fold